MHRVLTPAKANELAMGGYLRTGVTLPEELTHRIQRHFHDKPSTANNWYEIFNADRSGVKNVASQAGTSKGNKKPVAKKEKLEATMRTQAAFNDNKYTRNIYADFELLRPIMHQLFQGGVRELFTSRYMVITHDIFLSLSRNQTGFQGRHWDVFTKQQPFEGPLDLSFYIPLTRTNASVGGRLGVLPRTKLELSAANATRLPLTAMKRVATDHPNFKLDTIFRDTLDMSGRPAAPSDGDNEAISKYEKAYATGAMEANKEMARVRRINGRADWKFASSAPGEVLIFAQKEFHEAEAYHGSGKGDKALRDVYVIRMAPLYDIPVQLPSTLGGKPANCHVLDFKRGTLTRHREGVNIADFPEEQRHNIFF